MIHGTLSGGRGLTESKGVPIEETGAIDD